MAKNREALGGGLVANVDARNYRQFGMLFIAAHEDQGFVVALGNGQKGDFSYNQTLPQFGAWLAFFRRNNISHSRMVMAEYYTVPAEWPHQFTTDSTVMLDHEAGSTFERHWFDALNDAPLRGTPKKPDRPRMLYEARKPRLDPRVPFRPFPQLWDAFAGDAEGTAALDAGFPIETLKAASYALVTQGREAVSVMLFGDKLLLEGAVAREMKAEEMDT